MNAASFLFLSCSFCRSCSSLICCFLMARSSRRDIRWGGEEAEVALRSGTGAGWTTGSFAIARGFLLDDWASLEDASASGRLDLGPPTGPDGAGVTSEVGAGLADEPLVALVEEAAGAAGAVGAAGAAGAALIAAALTAAALAVAVLAAAALAAVVTAGAAEAAIVVAPAAGVRALLATMRSSLRLKRLEVVPSAGEISDETCSAVIIGPSRAGCRPRLSLLERGNRSWRSVAGLPSADAKLALISVCAELETLAPDPPTGAKRAADREALRPPVSSILIHSASRSGCSAPS